MEHFEGWLIDAVTWLRLAVETCGAITIGVGVLLGVFKLLRELVLRRSSGFNAVRLEMARYLAVALEFQLAADILSTAVAPNWDQIGKLGTIAVIRTFLNYFLTMEMQRERRAEGGEQPGAPAPA